MCCLLLAPAADAAPLSYSGGPVMHAEAVQFVLWGSSTTPAFAAADDGLFQYLASQSGKPGGYGGVLAQYGDSTGHNSANAVTYLGEKTITPALQSTTISETQVGTELQSQITAGNLPAPAGDGMTTLYVILFPPADTLTLQGSQSGAVFCAYHYDKVTATGHLVYVPIPSNANEYANGCGSDPSQTNNETSVLSHEYAEAINDPLNAENQIAWYNSAQNGGEIGENGCNGQQSSLGGFAVQKLWANLQSACIATEAIYGSPTAAFSTTTAAPSGQASAFDGSASTDPANNKINANNGLTAAIAPGIASYDWNFGDGSAHGSGATPSHTYASGGTYTVALTVTDNLGFTATVSHDVAITQSATTTTTTTTTPPAPDVALSPASAITATTATLNGSVATHGGATTAHFEYGPTAAYGFSTLAAPVSGDVGPVTAALASLTPATTYHFRLVATGPGGTTMSGDGTFATSAGPLAPPAADLAMGTPPSGATMASVLAHGLTMSFSCDGACSVSFTATAASTPRAAAAVILARGSQTLTKAGKGKVVLKLTAAGRRALRKAKHHKLVLVVTGVVRVPGGATGTPVRKRVTLRH